MPPSISQTCSNEAAQRKSQFKNKVRGKMEVCAALAAAEMIAEFVIGAATGGEGDVAVVGELAEVGGETAEAVEAIAVVRNLNEMSDLLKAAKMTKMAEVINAISESIDKSEKTEEVLQMIEKIDKITQDMVSAGERMKNSIKANENLNKLAENPISKAIYKKAKSAANLTKDTIKSAPQLETGNDLMDCALNNHMLMNSDSTCDNGYIVGNGSGDCNHCTQIFGQHEPRSASQLNKKYTEGGAWAGTVINSDENINRDYFTKLLCGYEDLKGQDNTTWAMRTPPNGICVIKGYTPKQTGGEHVYDNRPSPYNGFFSPGFFVDNEYECQRLSYELSDPQSHTGGWDDLTTRYPLEYGEWTKKKKYSEIENSGDENPSSWVNQQTYNNYQYYEIDHNMNLTNDPSPSSPGKVSLTQLLLKGKYGRDGKIIDDLSKQMNSKTTNAFELNKQSYKNLIDQNGDFINDILEFSSITGPAYMSYKYGPEFVHTLGNSFDQWSLNSMEDSWGISLFRDTDNQTTRDPVDIFKQKYKSSNVCNSDNFILVGTSTDIINQDFSGGPQCPSPNRKPHHCCPKLINGENCPVFQNDLKISQGETESCKPVLKKPSSPSSPSPTQADIVKYHDLLELYHNREQQCQGLLSGTDYTGTPNSDRRISCEGNKSSPSPPIPSPQKYCTYTPLENYLINKETSAIITAGSKRETQYSIPKFKTNYNKTLNELTSNCYDIKYNDIQDQGHYFFDIEGGIDCDNRTGEDAIVSRSINISNDSLNSLNKTHLGFSDNPYETYTFQDIHRPGDEDNSLNSQIESVSSRDSDYTTKGSMIGGAEGPQKAMGGMTTMWYIGGPEGIAIAEYENSIRNAPYFIENTEIKSLQLENQPAGSYWGSRAKIDNKKNYTTEQDSGATGYEHYLDPKQFMTLRSYNEEFLPEKKEGYLTQNSRLYLDQYERDYNHKNGTYAIETGDCQTCWSFKRATTNDFIGDKVYGNNFFLPNVRDSAGKPYSRYSQLEIEQGDPLNMKPTFKGCEGEGSEPGNCSDLEKTQFMQKVYDEEFCIKYKDKSDKGDKTEDNKIRNKFYRPVGIQSQGSEINPENKKLYPDICCSPIKYASDIAFVGCDATGTNSYFIDDIISDPNTAVRPINENGSERVNIIKQTNLNQCEKSIPRQCIGVDGDKYIMPTDMHCNYKIRNFYKQTEMLENRPYCINLLKGQDPPYSGMYKKGEVCPSSPDTTSAPGGKRILENQGTISDDGSFYPDRVPILKDDQGNQFDLERHDDALFHQICLTNLDNPISTEDRGGAGLEIPGNNCYFTNPALKTQKPGDRINNYLGYVPYKETNYYSDWNSSPTQHPYNTDKINLDTPNETSGISENYTGCALLPKKYNILDIEIYDKKVDWNINEDLGNIRYISSPNERPDNIFYSDNNPNGLIKVKCFDPRASPSESSPIQDPNNPNIYYYNAQCPDYIIPLPGKGRDTDANPGADPGADPERSYTGLIILIIISVLLVIGFIFGIKKFLKSDEIKAQEY